MWPPLVRKFLLPAHEALLRRPTMSIVQRLAADTSRFDGYIMHYQVQELAALLGHARAKIPYWQLRLTRGPRLSLNGPQL